jgi:nicotinamide riboside kinase
MIVAVEGPSAAGKTTWCRRHASHVVAEYLRTGQEPDSGDPVTQATYWAEVNCRRWQVAVGLEQIHGTAVCDTDPLKLHYSWTLARIGRSDPARFAAEFRTARRAFEQGCLGLADVILVRIPSPATLERQQRADHTRRRRAFEVHQQLAEPLREWYAAVECLDPTRVRWNLPENGLADVPAVPVRADRSDPTLLDALVEALPPLPRH